VDRKDVLLFNVMKSVPSWRSRTA